MSPQGPSPLDRLRAEMIAKYEHEHRHCGRRRVLCRIRSTDGDASKIMLSNSEMGTELIDRWVVVLTDPDFNGESPWSVIASSKEDAIRAALAEYDVWAGNDEPTPFTLDLVRRVYTRSWIGQLA